ncbi:hypothetical protein PHLGIDRAFT_102186 [Phlebiopsis gigantea 11061_1 CR5-6]|uniref:3-keto sterol reductase n=1 Tax=Phlebiopsis gigantea (strain 11061_1 CR5-6) TaxID=745531 RepID=A0A0C3PRK5_PHLG1|nr:hypothetical protein PHLGIDRAFT_102186 [Phlebiopsis gigantea 11061_1 CR5-6]
MSSPRPIIIVTGANSGIGFGICERLLSDLSHTLPPDAKPQFKSLSPGTAAQDVAPTESYDGATLILACRSEKKALEAKQRLLQGLDRRIAAGRRRADYDGHADVFRANLKIGFHQVDMSDAHSVFQFCEEIARTYPYVSHLVCNAGCAFWTGVDKLSAVRSILNRGLIWSITLPPFKLQHTGKMSVDGLGCTWQSNIFGHYIMYRHLKPLFTEYAARYSRPARLIWQSSLEGQPCWYDHDDWQLVKTDHSYEGTKFQIDLIASKLNERSLLPGGEGHVVRHFLVHPGIAHSNMTNGMVYAFFDTLKLILFYIARWFGSPNHTITPYGAAISATHIALASLLAIPSSLLAFAHRKNTDDPPRSLWDDSLSTLSLYADCGMESAAEARDREQHGQYVPLKFSSQTDSHGEGYVGVMPVLQWAKHAEESEFLVEKCEGLYQTFVKLEAKDGKGKVNGHANGHANSHTNGHANGTSRHS